MSNTSVKIALAFFVALAWPAVSFARHGGSAGFARHAGSAATGNVPISGIPRGPANAGGMNPANAGGMNNASVDPSGVGNASRVAPLPPPQISVPTIPH